MFYRIVAPHYVAGLEVSDITGYVIRSMTAPILFWCVGKPWSYCKSYFDKKGITYEQVQPE